MRKVSGMDASNAIKDGKVIESGGRYYRYDSVLDEVQYSEVNEDSWKKSLSRIDEFHRSPAEYSVIG